MKTNMNINSNRCSFVSPNIVNAEFSVSDEKKLSLKHLYSEMKQTAERTDLK